MLKQIYLAEKQNFKKNKGVLKAIFKININKKIKYNYPQLKVISKVLKLK